jgi:hypothetical protein
MVHWSYIKSRMRLSQLARPCPASLVVGKYYIICCVEISLRLQVGDTVMLYMLDGLLTWTAHSEH